MTRSRLMFSSFVLLATAFWISGCGPSSTDLSSQTPKEGQEDGDHDHGNQSHDAHDHGGHEHGEHGDADAAEIAENLAELSPEDRAAAKKQKICPVTDDPLGADGVPLKVTVNGRQVFICCEGCKKPLKKDPDKYLVKLSN